MSEGDSFCYSLNSQPFTIMTSASIDPQLSASSSPGFLRRWFSWKMLRRGLLVLATLVTLMAVARAIETWRARRAWENYARELIARGEKLALADYLPKPIPAGENFAATPSLVAIWQKARSAAGEPTPPPKALNPWDYYSPDDSNVPSMGSMDKNKFIDFKAWQDYYVKSGRLAPPNPSLSPAQNVLRALKNMDAPDQELRQARRRPQAQFSREQISDFGKSLVLAGDFKTLSMSFRLRALAYLETHQPTDAAEEIEIIWRLADLMNTQPTLISRLVAIAMMRIALEPIWHGLARNQWTAAQIEQLQARLSTFNEMADFQSALRAECACANEMFSQLQKGHYRGFPVLDETPPPGPGLRLPALLVYNNRRHLTRIFYEELLPLVDPATQRLWVPRFMEFNRKYCQPKDVAIGTAWFPYRALAEMTAPALAKTADKFARLQCDINFMITFCALERYRLAHSRYPETLAGLRPHYLAAVPTDVMDGQPLRYRRLSDTNALLYSVGLDLKDNGGQPPKKGNAMDQVEGDYPQTLRP